MIAVAVRRRNMKRAPLSGRWYKPVLFALAVVAAAWIATYLRVAMSGWLGAHIGWDFTHYVAGAQRWLSLGSPYEPHFLAGPYVFDDMAFVHPPIALPLFAAFTVLPAILWWAVPIGVVAWSVWTWRPSFVALTVIVLVFALPLTLEKILVGNSVMWCTAFVALGLRYGWPVVLLAVKPLFLPLALIGIRRRSTWVGTAIVVVVSLAFGSLWLDWLTVLHNFSGQSALYGLLDLPLVLVPVIAWQGRQDRIEARMLYLTVPVVRAKADG